MIHVLLKNCKEKTIFNSVGRTDYTCGKAKFGSSHIPCTSVTIKGLHYYRNMRKKDKKNLDNFGGGEYFLN